MRLHWHRRDLRGADNRSLARAAAADAVVPAFVFDPAVLSYASPVRVRFMLDALTSLRDWYRDRGSQLVVARGDPRDLIPALVAAFDAEAVGWNRDYSGLARRRDDDVAAALDADGVEHTRVQDALLHEPGSITTNGGDPYAVFTYFGRKWLDRPKDDPVSAPDADALVSDERVADADLPASASGGGSLPSPSEFDLEPDPAAVDADADVPAAGTDAARRRLGEFCDGPIHRYAEDRDYPARDATSRLSVHLRWGTIGVREVYAATEAAMDDAADDDERESAETFRTQLAWREFYAHVLRYNPDVVASNFKSYDDEIRWRDDPAGLRAWKRGETGFPVVDAGMRQLRAEAWMHNRVRMIVASFLTKDLLVDWREGYAHFRSRLADHDPANDSGGWQWAASTGTDAQPYFRIFNPTTQGERYDPDAEYVRRYVPELRGVDAEAVHRWPDLSTERRRELAPDYPDPVVDHAAARERALSTFRAARGEDDDGGDGSGGNDGDGDGSDSDGGNGANG